MIYCSMVDFLLSKKDIASNKNLSVDAKNSGCLNQKTRAFWTDSHPGVDRKMEMSTKTSIMGISLNMPYSSIFYI